MVYIIYHGVDLDGHCSGGIARYAMEKKHLTNEEDFQMIGLDFGQPMPHLDVQPSDVVYMLDFCIQPLEKTIELSKKCNLVVLDHHKSNLQELKKAGIKGVYGEQPNAACYYVWQYFFPKTHIPQAIKLLSDYDNWNNKNKDYWENEVMPFQYAMRGLKTDPKDVSGWSVWSFVLGRSEGAMTAYVHEKIGIGQRLVAFEEKQDAELMEQAAFDLTFENLKCLALNSDKGSNQFKTKWDPNKYDAMMSFRLHQNKYWAVSLYGTDENDIDLSVIAKKWGGGGHAKACGFQVEDINKILKGSDK
jgi:oligoribonuclease NrnB/cAMP/cGMP phosphodiesterase (DHH superfamily)